jgi:cell division protein FtsZ
VLRQGVQAISELVTRSGSINVDFANVRHLMKLGGGALMAIGQGEGEAKARKAIEQAIHHPLLDIGSIENAAGVLVNFTCGDDLTLFEVEEALNTLQDQAGSQAEIVFGVVHDECMQDRVEAILIVTGLGATTLEETLHQVEAKRNRPAESVPALAEMLSEIEPQAKEPFHHENTFCVDTGLTMPISLANDLDVPAFMRKMQHERNSR